MFPCGSGCVTLTAWRFWVVAFFGSSCFCGDCGGVVKLSESDPGRGEFGGVTRCDGPGLGELGGVTLCDGPG